MHDASAVIATATAWWVGQLKNPTFDNGSNDRWGSLGLTAGEYARRLAPPVPSDEVLQRFKQCLADAISEELRQHPSVVLLTDYAPQGLLELSAAGAGINPMCFPWKTYMLITRTGVQVRLGYDSNLQELPILPE